MRQLDFGMQTAALEHPGWEQTTVMVEELPSDPDAQVAAVITRMREYALADSGPPLVRGAVAQAAAEFPASDIAESIFQWIKSRLRFRNDEIRADEIGSALGDNQLVEILIRPVDLLTMRGAAGDCDDYSMLAASMLLAAGRPAYFCTVAVNSADPNRFSHVYVETVDCAGNRLPLDTSHGPRPGWEVAEVRTVYRRESWPVSRPIGGVVIALAAAAWLLSKFWRQ